MNLEQLGLSEYLREQFRGEIQDEAHLARVVQEHKELYTVQNTSGTFRAEITGNLRYSAESRADFPAVGDWVEINIFDGDLAIIYRVLPRYSKLERQAVGAMSEKQLIATNIDTAFIVQALDRDFNLNRLERYFVIAHNGNIRPVIILNKSDLMDEPSVDSVKMELAKRLKNPIIYITSTFTGQGLDELKTSIERGKTYCLLGSSGVGKSSIINYLAGTNVLEVREISGLTKKGKHTTTHRELLVLDNGGILIDTPGMREVGVTESISGIEMTFSQIATLTSECKFSNCTHTDEPGCRVLEAIEDGDLSVEEFENYKKLERQSTHFSSTVAEKRKKEKSFGKMAKEVMKYKKKNKY
jgi:ribosome biogenesis GTPase